MVFTQPIHARTVRLTRAQWLLREMSHHIQELSVPFGDIDKTRPALFLPHLVTGNSNPGSTCGLSSCHFSP